MSETDWQAARKQAYDESKRGDGQWISLPVSEFENLHEDIRLLREQVKKVEEQRDAYVGLAREVGEEVKRLRAALSGPPPGPGPEYQRELLAEIERLRHDIELAAADGQADHQEVQRLRRQVRELSESLASYGLCDECRNCDRAMDPVTGALIHSGDSEEEVKE